MKIKNCSLELISKVIGFNQRTVKHWSNRYSENSIKGIIDEHKTGRKSKITDK